MNYLGTVGALPACGDEAGGWRQRAFAAPKGMPSTFHKPCRGGSALLSLADSLSALKASVEYDESMRHESTTQGVDLSAVGALLADPARAAILAALLGGMALPAGELARIAGVTPSTASIHLARLLAAGWVVVERRGRHRYYRLGSAEVATVLEQIAWVAPPSPVRSLRGRQQIDALRLARSCYDHLAGQVGVALTDALVEREALRVEGSDFALTSAGATFLRERGVVVPVPTGRRAFARRCLDWSERRDHVAGALGAAIFVAWETQGWVARRERGRALRLTPVGVAQLPTWGVTWPLEETRPAPIAAR